MYEGGNDVQTSHKSEIKKITRELTWVRSREPPSIRRAVLRKLRDTGRKHLQASLHCSSQRLMFAHHVLKCSRDCCTCALLLS